MGVDVASFGDFFADKRMSIKSQAATAAFDNASAGKSLDPAQPLVEISVGSNAVPAPAQLPPVDVPKRGGRSANEPIRCLVYNDPFGSTYKKYIFTADGKYLLGGMMIGDVSDFVKLVAIVKKKVCFLFFCNIGGINYLFFLVFRKRWKFLRLSSLLGRRRKAMTTVGTWTMMRKFVAVTCVVPFSFSP